jgi:hypothetical protein
MHAQPPPPLAFFRSAAHTQRDEDRERDQRDSNAA